MNCLSFFKSMGTNNTDQEDKIRENTKTSVTSARSVS
jgi:hypothetical protein